jgi:hypothetical protein
MLLAAFPLLFGLSGQIPDSIWMMIRILPLLIPIFVSPLACDSGETTQPDATINPPDYGLEMDSSSQEPDGSIEHDMTLDSMLDEGVVDLGGPDAAQPDSRFDADSMLSSDASMIDMFEAAPDAAIVDAAADGIEEQIHAVLERMGVPDIEWVFPPEEIDNQSMFARNRVDFLDGLTLALQSFQENGDDQESPIALLEFTVGPLCTDGSDTERVRCFMNQEGSIMRLVTADGPPAENRESVDENWIFFMTLPALSDHLLWAIVDREGNRPAYNYGFN